MGTRRAAFYAAAILWVAAPSVGGRIVRDVGAKSVSAGFEYRSAMGLDRSAEECIVMR